MIANRLVSKASNIKKASYNFEVYYTKNKSFYVLEKITNKISYEYSEQDDGQILNSESELKVLNVNTDNPQELDIRDYFEDVEFDEGFWTDFNY